jgi:hypothetical protein
MYYTKGRSRLEKGAAPDLWRNTLSQIPTVFGRLVYLSSLRDPNTGRYEHAGLAQMFGDRDADNALRQSHSQTFSEWLCFDLEQQKADLDFYLSALLDRRKVIVDTWARLKPYRNLVPTSAGAAEIQLYLTDFETILQLLKNYYGVSEEI